VADTKLAKVPVYQKVLFSETITEAANSQGAEPLVDSWRVEEDIVIWRIEVHYLRKASNISDRRWTEWFGFGFTGINQHPRDMGSQLEQIFAMIEHGVTSNVNDTTTASDFTHEMIIPPKGVWDFDKGYPVGKGDTIIWSMYWENDSAAALAFDGYAVIYYSKKQELR
jgi:hypothetical protein